MSSITTTIDFSTANRLRARQLVASADSERKLALLHRVYRQFVSGTLPSYSETSVEQSWNEQVFAAVLDYQTQFSHGKLPFHLKAKNRQGGFFTDFSLGFFGIGDDHVIAAAELKTAGTPLDRSQGTKYGNLTPVQQAFRAAHAEPGCIWVLVSNFVELRLYHVTEDQTPVATINLGVSLDVRDLMLFQALFCRHALLGDDRRPPELAIMHKLPTDHPSSPLGPEEGHYRIVMRFTPKLERELPLFEAEQALVPAITKAPGWYRLFAPPNFGGSVHLPVRLANGWISIDGGNPEHSIKIRVAMSLFGQLQVTILARAVKYRINQADQMAVEFVWLMNGLRFFAGLLQELYTMAATSGFYAAELREADEKFMDVRSDILAFRAGNSGISNTAEILAGDFTWEGATDTLTGMAAKAACELAVYFRRPNGGIGIDSKSLEKAIDLWNAQDIARQS
jgi:hypothetical protein